MSKSSWWWASNWKIAVDSPRLLCAGSSVIIIQLYDTAVWMSWYQTLQSDKCTSCSQEDNVTTLHLQTDTGKRKVSPRRHLEWQSSKQLLLRFFQHHNSSYSICFIQVLYCVQCWRITHLLLKQCPCCKPEASRPVVPQFSSQLQGIPRLPTHWDLSNTTILTFAGMELRGHSLPGDLANYLLAKHEPDGIPAECSIHLLLEVTKSI